MFEEAQLYSPVTRDEDGGVTVHLDDEHPGVNDPEYRERRNAIADGCARLARGRACSADRLLRGRAGGLADRLARARSEA